MEELLPHRFCHRPGQWVEWPRQYSILSGNQGNVFQMDPLSGVLTANVILDYEYTSAYRFAPSSDPFD